MSTSNGVISTDESVLTREERTVQNRLGYNVELYDETGKFNDVVLLPDDTSVVVRLHFASINELGFELKEILKGYYAYLLPRYLPSSMRVHHDAIACLSENIVIGKTFDEAIDEVVIANPASFVSPIKSLVRYLILHEYDALSFDKAEETLRLEGYSSNKNAYLTLFTMDEELGPFTREELRVLNEALKNEDIHIADRLILALCIQFGLRPIQICLLKEKDFIEDVELGLCYLNVPRVKQKGMQYRRDEFTKRLVDVELADLIKRVINNNREKFADLTSSESPMFYRKTKINWGGRLYLDTHIREFDLAHKSGFVYHLQPQTVRSRLQDSLVKYLPLSPRTGKQFHLTPYRFRYTLGSNAVMEGMTEEEVADLLDHSSTLCVKHYFRYTREMWELLENATAKRTEQQHFTAAWNREEDLSGNIYGKEIIELHAYTAIGKCQKEAACYLEPAVACYSCGKFCPNKDKASHNNALTSLQDRKQHFVDSASTTLSKQLDEAIAGCEAAIAYAGGGEVININEGNGDE
ncbi:Phage integrase family [Vibrio sp. B1ASS3]|uniref:site-specific integrase n=1 Tax=Vibrio sp. B1ASS3 TaxID=2751176 RepID=UPI001ABBA6DF|nr:site-specific integrase [Vibrio sp. B1ASS3]CAD7797537.1 Phage integrase family [Vibrio sp. B1ASS3]CAE6880105.1 Phage integrase family [Vibrio sp. B1ASS3]